MSDPYLSEIRIVSFNFAPKSWALCNGQLLPISQNQALFSLLGTTYGGNGQTTFALPNLQGQAAIHMGQGPGTNHPLGEKAGTTATTIDLTQMPLHFHPVSATNTDTAAARTAIPSNNTPGPANNLYGPPTDFTTFSPATVTSVGGSQPHNNLMPYLVLNFIIALQGIYPSRN